MSVSFFFTNQARILKNGFRDDNFEGKNVFWLKNNAFTGQMSVSFFFTNQARILNIVGNLICFAGLQLYSTTYAFSDKVVNMF